MNKVVLARDLEVKELKERLEVKMCIDDKQKDHLLEQFKKWQGRKPNSTVDYQFMSVINHYESQMEKLNKQVDKLKLEGRSYD